MTQRRVDWYSAVLGYGFIIPEDGSTKVLVQRTNTEGSEPLENCDKVVYEAIRGKEGIEAGSFQARLGAANSVWVDDHRSRSVHLAEDRKSPPSSGVDRDGGSARDKVEVSPCP